MVGIPKPVKFAETPSVSSGLLPAAKQYDDRSHLSELRLYILKKRPVLSPFMSLLVNLGISASAQNIVSILCVGFEWYNFFVIRRLRSKLFWFLAVIMLVVVSLFALFSYQYISSQYKTPKVNPLNVLFIGNSYTSTNSLPTIFQEIAVSAGYARPVVESSTPGGYTFQEHLASSATCSMISSQHWDVVIMQEQSEVPAEAQTMPEVNKSFLSGFEGLYGLVKESNPEARVILFETWARSADCWSNGTADPVLDGKNPSDMLQRLKAGYEEASQSVISQGEPPVEIARVGELWGINNSSASPINLYDSDGSHPNFAGSYLAALDIFSTVYGPLTKDLSYCGTLGKNQADFLQNLLIRNFSEIQEP